MASGTPNITNLRRQDVTRKILRQSLYRLTRFFWDLVVPAEFCPGWHLEAKCEHLEAVTRGQIDRLLILEPPRHSKSSIAAVFWPVWEWIQERGPNCRGGPHTRWLTLSYANHLSVRDADLSRTIMKHQRFLELFGDYVQIDDQQDTKSFYRNNHRGQRIASSITGMATGEGGERVLVDDAMRAQDIHSPTVVENVITWWKGTMTTRINDPRDSVKVITGQRLFRGDLPGHVLKNEMPGWEVVCLPLRFVESKRCHSVLGVVDPRQKEGELLWSNRYMKDPEDKASSTNPEFFRYTEEWLQKEIISKLEGDAGAQLQQDPASEESILFEASMFPLWEVLPPAEELFWFWTWDMSFKDEPGADHVAGIFMAFHRPLGRYYVIDRKMARVEYTDARTMIIEGWKEYPQTNVVLVEESANGYAILSDLKASSIPLEGWKVGPISKMSKWRSASSRAKQGKIWMPKGALWLFDPGPPMGLVYELCQLPVVEHDDQSDSLTNGIIWNSENEAKLGVLHHVNIGYPF